MDLNSLLGYATSLGLLYGWMLIAAGLFAVGERLCRGMFGRATPADAKDATNR